MPSFAVLYNNNLLKTTYQFHAFFPLIFFVCVSNVPLLAVAQFQESRLKTLKGMVVRAEDEAFLIGVHIYAKKAHQGAVSDQKGMFEMMVDANDTLVVTFVGYQRQMIPIAYFTDNPIELIIRMDSETIELPGITIFGDPNIDYLKRPERTAIRIPGLQAPAAKPDVDVPVGSLDYGILSRWGKEAKEKRKLMEVYSQDRREMIYTQTVSSDSVRAIFMHQYDINEKQYNDFVIFFNTYKPLMDRQDPEDIVRVMHQTFLRYKPSQE
jgi:hypothetical protein